MATANESRLNLRLAIDYSAQSEITRAASDLYAIELK